jgi:hypothetical protein
MIDLPDVVVTFRRVQDPPRSAQVQNGGIPEIHSVTQR